MTASPSRAARHATTHHTPADQEGQGCLHDWEDGVALDETGSVAEWIWCRRCGETRR